MNISPFLEHVGAGLLRSNRAAEGHAARFAHAPLERASSVALSRQTGTGGLAVAQAVGGRLGWTVYDHQLLEMISRDLKVRLSVLESIDERHLGWLRESIQSFFVPVAVCEETFVRQ